MGQIDSIEPAPPLMFAFSRCAPRATAATRGRSRYCSYLLSKPRLYACSLKLIIPCIPTPAIPHTRPTRPKHREIKAQSEIDFPINQPLEKDKTSRGRRDKKRNSAESPPYDTTYTHAPVRQVGCARHCARQYER